MGEKLEDLQKKIGIKFKDISIVQNAFIHRSYLNENRDRKRLESNEKLEFLGDSVLSLITSMYLYNNFPELNEGKYTDIKAAIVKTESLAEASKKLGLGNYLYLSKGEEKSGGRKNIHILADVFEALIASIFIDGGFNLAYKFVLNNLFANKLGIIIKNKLYVSEKNKLQEYIQNTYKTLPKYKVVSQTGPEHQKIFRVEVYLKNKKIGSGTGKTKKKAEELAAKNAIENNNFVLHLKD